VLLTAFVLMCQSCKINCNAQRLEGWKCYLHVVEIIVTFYKFWHFKYLFGKEVGSALNLALTYIIERKELRDSISHLHAFVYEVFATFAASG
jgi:hypothetical protein